MRVRLPPLTSTDIRDSPLRVSVKPYSPARAAAGRLSAPALTAGGPADPALTAGAAWIRAAETRAMRPKPVAGMMRSERSSRDRLRYLMP